MEEHITTVSFTIMACCVLHNICIDVGDPTEIDPVCYEDIDSLIIPDVHVQMEASDIIDAIMEYI